jgi:hypothetical protein
MNKFPMFSGAAPIDDKGIMDALRGSDIVRKAAAERDTHVVGVRKTAVAKLEKMAAEVEGKFSKQQAELQQAIKESREAEIAYRRKADRAYELQSRSSAEWSLHGQEIARLETQLAETASAEIVPFIADMRTLWENCLKQYEVHHSVETVNIIGKKISVTRNNESSVHARQEAIRDAIEAAEKMRLEPDQSTVAVRLEQLRQDLPSIKGI